MDTITVSTTKSAQMTSDSLDKNKVLALDWIRGESTTLSHRFSVGKNIWQIKPKNLKFFEFMILSHVLHEFVPNYSCTKWNCYWFATMLIDTIIKIFGLKEEDTLPDNDIRKE
jgi:hypothetical protein